MARPGRLFLLFMFSSLLFSILIDAAVPKKTTDEVAPKKTSQKVKEGFKKAGKVALNTFDKILTAVTPFLGLIPVYGPLISAVAGSAMMGVAMINQKGNPVLDALKLEFETLNFKIDKYHVEQTWNIWAASAYHKPERDINLGWTSYQTLVKSLFDAKTDAEKKKSHITHFINSYEKYEPAARTLNVLLKKEGTSFINELGQQLAEHVKCHEKDVRDYTVFINKLIYKANTMNQVYYNLKGITSSARVDEQADNAYNAALAMFQTHKECIANSLEYVKKDVEGKIDNTINRDKLAMEVRLFLEKTYDRYDWMVVAFLTKNSKHDIIVTMNHHVLAGFTEVTKGDITVAVTRQVKGTHTKAGTIKQSIDSCFAKSTPGCTDVVKKLDKCPVSYTAVHVYTDQAHDSHGAEEAPFEVMSDPDDNKTPYVYTGKCEKSPGVHGGHFVVLIETDEELLSKDPCAKMNCGGAEKGKCVQVKNMYVALCECKYPYYGSECEETLDDYKKELEAAIPKE